MNELLRIAWRNVWRHKRRSVLSALAVGFAVAVLSFSMALQHGSYASMIQNTVRAGTGHIQIQQRGHWPDRELSKKLDAPGPILEWVGGLRSVLGAAPRITAAALVSRGDRTFGALLLGVDPDREKQVSTLPQVLSNGRYLSGDDREGALVGYALANNLGARVGDEVVFLGQGADGSIAASRLIVRGLVQSGFSDLDRTMVAASLQTIQEAFTLSNAVTEIALLLERDEVRPGVMERIREHLRQAGRPDAVVLGWPTLLPGVEETITLDWYSGLILYTLLVLVVGLGIANTFLMAFIERIREFGVLLSLGMKPARLFLLVYGESVFLSLFGIAVGLVLGLPLVYYFQIRGINFGKESEALLNHYGLSAVIHPQVSFSAVGLAVGIVLATALLLALYPAYQAGRLQPVPAMRQG